MHSHLGRNFALVPAGFCFDSVEPLGWQQFFPPLSTSFPPSKAFSPSCFLEKSGLQNIERHGTEAPNSLRPILMKVQDLYPAAGRKRGSCLLTKDCVVSP